MQQSLIRSIARTADNTADIRAAKHIATCLSGTLVQAAAITITHNAADKFTTKQFILIGLVIFKDFSFTGVHGAAGAATQRNIVCIANNTADKLSGMRTGHSVCAAQNQAFIGERCNVLTGFIARTVSNHIARNAANRAIARYSGAVCQGFDGRTVRCQAARNTADAACDTAGRQSAGYGARCRQLGYRLGIAGLNNASHTADALCVSRGERCFHLGFGAVHGTVLQRAAAVTADCADTFERARVGLHLRIEQAQSGNRAGVFLEQTEVCRVIGNRIVVQL